MIIKFLTNKKEKDQLALKKLQSSIGHMAYSWKYGRVAGCTCEACNKTWDIKNTYIRLEDFMDFIDNKLWIIKYKNK